MNDLMKLVYEEKEVRSTVDEQGNVWFVVNDVCEILGIVNASQAYSALDEYVKGVSNVYTLGGTQQLNTVSEPGLYELIFASRKEEAKAFKRWVFTEVLPSIRKYGFYMTPDLKAYLASHPEAAANFGQYLLDDRNAVYNENHNVYKQLKQAQRDRDEKSSYAIKVLDVIKQHAPKEVMIAENIVKIKEGLK